MSVVNTLLKFGFLLFIASSALADTEARFSRRYDLEARFYDSFGSQQIWQEPSQGTNAGSMVWFPTEKMGKEVRQWDFFSAQARCNARSMELGLEVWVPSDVDFVRLGQWMGNAPQTTVGFDNPDHSEFLGQYLEDLAYSFWSSSQERDNPAFAFYFNGETGDFDYAPTYFLKALRCVGFLPAAV